MKTHEQRKEQLLRKRGQNNEKINSEYKNELNRKTIKNS